MAAVTIEALIKDLQASKAKVDQISVQLEKEKERGRGLYDHFRKMQEEMQAAFGIEPPKTARKRKERAPMATLRSAASALIRKLKNDGKSAAEAKTTVLATLAAEAKKELGLNVLPENITQHIEKQITKRFHPQK